LYDKFYFQGLWGQLSNSGNALELKVQKHDLKIKVTDFKTSEKRVGYRGSKSVTGLSLNKLETVKEQRVYGSFYDLSYLRCTLLGFERNRLVKIPSNQIMLRRLFTNSNNISTNTTSINFPILPLFITGFTDAEGCFTIILRKSPRSNTG